MNRLTTALLSFPILTFLVFTHLAYPQSTTPTPSSEARSMKPGDELELRLAGGQKQLLEIACSSDGYVRVILEQSGVDVVIRLLNGDRSLRAEYDSDPRLTGKEEVEFVSSGDGTCGLSVEPRQRSAAPGGVRINYLESRPATDKDRALDEARRSLTEGIRLWRAAKYHEALPLTERTLALRERELGPEHADVGMAFFAIGNIYSDIPDYKKAEHFYAKALEIRSKALGSDHFSLASIYNNSGALYKELGQYTKAETLYEKALEIRERVLEPGHLLIASTMNNLAIVARLRGNEAKATALYRRVLEIREKALGPDHPDVATALNNLANPDLNIATAEPLYLRALAIREKALAPDHPDIAQTLYNLAVLYATAGDPIRAEPFCDRALSIYQKSLGAEHPYTAFPLNLSAVIAKNKGDFPKAEDLFKQTIRIREKMNGPLHPDLANSLAGLANLYAMTGQIDKAIEAQSRANEIFDYNTSLNLLSGSEREKLTYLRTMTHLGDQTLTLSFRESKGAENAVDVAFISVLRRKGRVLDAMSDTIASLRNRLKATDLAVLDDLNDTNSKLASAVLNGRQEMSAADHQKHISQLEKKKDGLEKELSRRSSIYLEANVRSPLAAVQKALPLNAALIEFGVYRSIDRKSFELSVDTHARPDSFGEARYVVFVLRPSGHVRALDLGATRPIDTAIAAFRDALREPARGNLKGAARDVYGRVFKPIGSLVRETEHLLISPEGQLNLMPFEALIDERGRYLVEDHSISYLTSGRDLFRLGNPAPDNGQALIFAHPQFGEPVIADSGTTRSSHKSKTAERRSVTSTNDLMETFFGPLNGTAEEARSIHALFPNSVVITGAQATETSVKAAAVPRMLHLATHGFFITSDGSSPEGPVTNPLLRSGLAFAGANRRSGAADDGILTALEASGLNLHGTKLVVLSACDTGLGEIRNGEGVYGLRRSFVLAGAESLVMSLWPVSDQVTRELMTGYYQNMKKGMGRGEALRQVRLQMIKQPNRRHPFYWASFIQSGEWANLDGKR